MNFQRARNANRTANGAAFSVADMGYWIFDLDNTLYPQATDLFLQIEARIKAFVSERLGLEADEAYKVQKEYLVRFGTTLRGLMDLHDVVPHEFLDFVHDVDFGVIPPDPNLVGSLERLPGAKYVFTNGTRAHAEAVLERIGAEAVFDEIFDIVDADFVPKPVPQTYAALVSHFGIEPERAVIVEDMVRNLKPAHDMGMITVWLNTGGEWGKVGYDPGHIDIEIDDLGAWLSGLLRGFDEENDKK